MNPINLKELSNEVLTENAVWWCRQLLNWTDVLKNSPVKNYTRNMTATLGVLNICNIYIKELTNRGLVLVFDMNKSVEYCLECRNKCEKVLENMEDWVYGTERLRTPFIGSDKI